MSTPAGKQRPLVSVIVPTYADLTPRLTLALASIWAQDGLGNQFDVEPIVIDNASTGPTEEVVRCFPGTKYVRLDTNTGQSGGRNVGLAKATGKYVAFLDHDDLWLPHRLSAQVAVLEQAQGVEVAYSQRIAYAHDGISRGVFPDRAGPSGRVFETAVKWQICHLDTILVPRAAVDEVGGFDESLPINEDNDWVARLSFFFPFRYVHGVVAIWLPSMNERTPEQWRASLLKRRDNILALIEGGPNETEMRRLIDGTASWHIAYRLFRAGQLDDARRGFLQWLAEFPPLENGSWARSRIVRHPANPGSVKEMILLFTLASDSPIDEARSLCAEVRRTIDGGSFRPRLAMRAFLADVWTAVAVRVASGHRRNDKMASSAAARAILQNPLKPLSRPGLLRLVGRAIAPV
jgi:glycosyltransferase involved in cell wall biosynthesis